ncbi:MAG: TetR/AcrR family transcriptional regulator [Hyphomicrobium sp.]|nr:TetR/AcrR family transcriptional regulator [Hyphomicrobium sp.]
MSESPTSRTSSGKQRYHHGDLRQALIDASHQLLVEKGAENFSLADACRVAGVSTAAPYKHFRDKLEILKAIVEQGFDRMSQRSLAAVRAKGEGTIDGVIAMGQAYIAFAMEETAVFRLMFGHNTAIKRDEHVEDTGRSCFKNVIAQITLYCEKNEADGDPLHIALSLWTFVHGAACLLIDEDYENVAPGIDIDAMIADAAIRLLPTRKKG